MFKSHNSRIALTIMAIVFITVATLITIVKFQTESSLQDIQRKNSKNLLKAITHSVENEYHSIQYHRRKTMEQRKGELKSFVDIAYNILEEIHHKLESGLFTKNQAQSHAKTVIRNLRWANDVGYFWINDTTLPTPAMVMHPTNPELDGQVMDNPDYNCAFGTDENLFEAFNRICRTDGSGYVDYLWPKPIQSGELTNKQPKLSYVRLFEEWDWIIGSGIYIDDIESEAQDRLDAVIRELRKTFMQARFGESSYMFMFSKDKQVLIHPILEGRDASQIRNPDTEHFILDDIMLAEQTPQKQMDYLWDKPDDDSDKVIRKRLFVHYFEPLGWYICVSYYVDDIEQPAAELSWKMLLLSAILLSVAFFISYLLGKNLSTPLRELSDAAEKIEKEGVGATDIPIGGSSETRELGQILSNTFTTIQDKEYSLQQSEFNLRQAQNNLKQQLRFTQSLLEAIPTPVDFKDADGKFIGCNQAFSDFMGLSSERIRGKTALDLWPQDLAEQYTRIDQDLLANPRHQSLDMSVLTGKGQRRDIILSKNIFWDDMGNIGGLISSFLDITERLKAEKAVRASEENLKATLDSIGDGVITTDIEGRIIRMNHVAEQLTGWQFSASEGKTLLSGIKLMDAENKEPIDAPLNRVLEAQEPLHLCDQMIMITRDGKRRFIATTCSQIRSGSGNLAGAVLAFRDITEQTRIEDQLRQSHKMDALGQLAGGVAHDFNNMLAAIMGAAELLSVKLPDDSEHLKFVKMIINSAEKAAGLTDKLLSFSRKGKLLSTPIDVHGSITDGTTMLQRSIDKRVEIILGLNAEITTVIGDPAQLQSMIINLGVNAGHAMPSGGQLSITTNNIELGEEYCRNSSFEMSPGLYIEINFEDTGVGIEDKLLDRIFDPFFTTKAVGVGTGLGLAAVYGAIKEHFGAITVFSEQNEGTTFHILLPVNSEATVGTKLNIEDLHTGSGTILVVDDESIIRRTVKHTLNDMGYTVLLAEDGVDALDVYGRNQEHIDLVLLDMIMPKMNGEDTFRALRKLDPSAKVIMASGFTKEAGIIELKKQGLLGFMKKPYRRIDINRILTKIL